MFVFLLTATPTHIIAIYIVLQHAFQIDIFWKTNRDVVGEQKTNAVS